MERQFYRRHEVVERNFDWGDPIYVRYRLSHDQSLNESVAVSTT